MADDQRRPSPPSLPEYQGFGPVRYPADVAGPKVAPGVYVGTTSAGIVPLVHNFLEIVHTDGARSVYEYGDVTGTNPYGIIGDMSQRYRNALGHEGTIGALVPFPAGVHAGDRASVEAYLDRVEMTAQNVSRDLNGAGVAYSFAGGYRTTEEARASYDAVNDAELRAFEQEGASPEQAQRTLARELAAGGDRGAQADTNGNTVAAYVLRENGISDGDIAKAFGQHRVHGDFGTSFEKPGTPQFDHTFPDYFEFSPPTSDAATSRGGQPSRPMTDGYQQHGRIVSIDYGGNTVQQVGRETVSYDTRALLANLKDPAMADQLRVGNDVRISMSNGEVGIVDQRTHEQSRTNNTNLGHGH